MGKVDLSMASGLSRRFALSKNQYTLYMHGENSGGPLDITTGANKSIYLVYRSVKSQ